MKEGTWTVRLLAQLRLHPEMKGATIWKLSDSITSGIPDFVITVYGRTTWWEVKIQPNKLTHLQRYYIDRLNSQSSQQIAYVITVDRGLKRVLLDIYGPVITARRRLLDEIVLRAVPHAVI